MLLQRKERLPEGGDWLYEIKLDGYRAVAIKNKDRIELRSCNDNDFSRRYPIIVKSLGALPDDTVIDGEVVAFDETGKPSFNVLQNHGSRPAAIFYYASMLQKAGLITYRYGTLTILNPEGLTAGACECYDMMETEFERLFDHNWLDIADICEPVP